MVVTSSDVTDVFTKEKRSYVMSRIRSRGTKIEHAMEKILSSAELKFEAHPKLLGSPDFVIPRKKIAIFCDGDFWHGYNYNGKKKPPAKFWRQKIEGTMKRDKSISRRLRNDGWSVLRFWEHDIEERPDFCLKKIKRFTR